MRSFASPRVGKMLQQSFPSVVPGYKLSCVLQTDLDNTFYQQWDSLLSEDKRDLRPTLVCRSRDRYTMPFVFDHSRVKLDSLSMDYINANFLLDKQYIAAQAPLPSTLSHFWSMIWQEKVSLIVMLTETQENGVQKAHRYWPTSTAPEVFSLNNYIYTVELKEKSLLGSSILIRKFLLSCNMSSESREITQYQFINWPDHGCPSNFLEIITLIKLVNLSSSKPILVHCSAGVGRSGTFITIRAELLKAVQQFQKHDYQSINQMDRIKVIRNFLKNYEFNFIDTVRKLRQDRRVMVLKEDQFLFCFQLFAKLIEESEESNNLLRVLLPLFYPTS